MNYNNDNEIRTGLWAKQAQSGLTYWSGSIKMPDGQEFWVTLFENKDKKNDRSPDRNVILKPKEAKPEVNQNQSYDDDDDEPPF